MSPINFHLIRDTLHYSISPLFDCPLPINQARTWRSWRIRRGDNSTQLETCTLFHTRCSYALVRPLGPSVLVHNPWVEILRTLDWIWTCQLAWFSRTLYLLIINLHVINFDSFCCAWIQFRFSQLARAYQLSRTFTPCICVAQASAIQLWIDHPI